MDFLRQPDRVFGIDWSGAKDAGRHIWIAEGCRDDETLILVSLTRGENLPGSFVNRERCLTAVRKWISGKGSCAVGMDFPFGLPWSLMDGWDWQRFVREFPNRFADPDEFRHWALQETGGRELKRRTDRITKTPFSAYNIRLYRQTYWGITSIIAPLALEQKVAVLPLQPLRFGVPWLLETCPASLLKRLQLYTSYKGRSPKLRSSRQHIVRWLEKNQFVRVANAELKSAIISDPGGDALDAMLAAIATDQALQHPEFPRIHWHQDYAIEACVYA